MRQFIRCCAIAVAITACHRTAEVGTGAPAALRAGTITGADQLVAAMHDRYAGKWYHNMTFTQKSTTLRPDGTPARVETWYEAGVIPGRLRIDLGERSKGNGVLYRGDSVYQFQEGKLVDKRVGRNPLMVLGFDVYAQTPARTLAQLEGEKIDLGILRTDTLYGRGVFVVGAGPQDSTSNQFWIDRERLLFVRLIQTDPARKVTRDIRFEKYVQHGGGWVAEEVKFFSRGALVFHEEYSNVRTDAPIDSTLFVPEKWSTASHWYTP